MKKWNHSLLCQNNKGSAIINVIIAMLFIIALGSALLYTTYIGYSVSVSNRAEEGNFYSAESEMNRMLTGIHTYLSDSLVTAYTETLTQYAKGTMSSPQTEFNKNLINKLTASTVTVGKGTAPLITKDVNNGNLYYSIYALSGFLGGTLGSFDGTNATVNKDGNTIILSGDKNASGNYVVTQTYDSKGVGYLTLKGISMSFKSAGGYLTTIKTDIKINIPEFLVAAASSAEVGDYAVIAENGITQGNGTGKPQISGNVYADGTGIITDGSGNEITFSGNVCAKGGIKVENGAKLLFNAPDKELWTDEITLEGTGYSSINLSGKIYVANDLILNGIGSSATLSGEYYGFGSGNTPDESSAILVNALGSKLTMSTGLNRLSLAGVSYIEINKDKDEDDLKLNGGPTYTTPIIMGESISTKADQLAYLLPPECMKNYYFTNPCILDDDPKNAGSKIKPDYDENTVLWTINGVDKTLLYYLGDGNKKGEVVNLYSPHGDFAYVFIVFKDRNAANEYFKDYFTAHPERIEQYADLYLTDLSNKANKVSAAGNTFYNDAGGKLSLYPADTAVLTGNMSTRYKNKISPLDKFIYRDKLNAFSGTLEFKKGTDIVAIVTDDDSFDYSSLGSNLKIIIAKGSATISNDFTGIIIAGKTVSINADVTASPIDPSILDAVATDSSGKKYILSDFVRGSAGSSTENVWDLNNLVVYDNWKKN